MVRKRTWLLLAAVAVPLLLFCTVLLGEWWIRTQLESMGQRALGVPVTVGTVRLGLWPARAVLHDLSIANPEGFTLPHALRATRISMAFDWMEVFSSRHIVQVVETEGLHLNIEGTTAQNNWTVLQSRWQGGQDTPPTGSPQATRSTGQQTQTFRVHAVRIVDPHLTLRLKGPSFETAADAVRLNTMEWSQEVGTDGMSVEETVQQVAGAFGQQVSARLQLLPLERRPAK
ncbi:MAG: hypothetical protein U0172_11250 [Nitrospiraceae bacterium]